MGKKGKRRRNEEEKVGKKAEIITSMLIQSWVSKLYYNFHFFLIQR